MKKILNDERRSKLTDYVLNLSAVSLAVAAFEGKDRWSALGLALRLKPHGG
jgi:hypothetical protein